MKTIGQQAAEFRRYKKWNTSQMAREVGTSRQNIEHLEDRGNLTPKYVKELAQVMGMSVDDLIAGKFKIPEEGAYLELAIERIGMPPRLIPTPVAKQVVQAIDDLEPRRAHFLDDLNDMLKRFKNPDELRTAYTRCILAIEDLSMELRQASMPPEEVNPHHGAMDSPAKLASAPKPRTPQNR